MASNRDILWHRSVWTAPLIGLGLALAACGGGSSQAFLPGPTPTAGPDPTPSPGIPPAEASYTARGSVEQVYVLDAQEGQTLELVSPTGAVLQTGAADEMGSLIFRDVPPGDGYIVASVATREESEPLLVTTEDDAPDPSFYSSQVVDPGYGYIETRDGTLLSINVRLPGPPDGGPYPTVIEYSGYDPANPDASQPATAITTALGYATVGINMRGTGCSGGAFQFFETLQSTDGYDAVEIIAAQPWVKDNEVGLVGLSYPGISQLFVARLRPPSLKAIAPLSVISDTGRGVLRPGGIYNNGFAKSWAEERKHDAQPGGQAWSQRRIDAGDQTCIDNQKLRFQSPDILDMIAENEFYVPAVADPVTPSLFVHDIDVPVFLAGAWQDEQVGSYFANMLSEFTGTSKVHFTLTNGSHVEPFAPPTFSRWTEFLDFYVAERLPQSNPVTPVIMDVLKNDIFHTEQTLMVDPPRFTDAGSYEEALAQYEAEPKVRVLFDNGAGTDEPGAPIPGFELSFAAWPPPETAPTAWYLDADGFLGPAPSADDGSDSFLYDPTRGQLSACDCPSTGDVWVAQPAWTWQQPPAGTFASYVSAELTEDMIMAGSGSVDLWLGASGPDVDLQVTLSEVRPDGQETYVQNGWLRASRRFLDAAQSSDVRPVQTHLESDAAPLPPGEFSLARVEIFPFAHAFRAGSRIRLVVSSPGGDRSHWKFESQVPAGEVTTSIARTPVLASRIVLPVIPGVEIPTPLPACGALRNQPCRDFDEG